MEQCAAELQQLDRDRAALRRQQDSIAAGQKALEEWTKENSDAQRKALETGVRTVAGGVAEALEAAAKNTRTFHDFLQDRRVPLFLLGNKDTRAEVEKAYQAYRNGGLIARSAQTINGALLANDLWELFKNEVGAVARLQVGGTERLRRIVEDEQVRDYLQADENGRAIVRDLTKSLVELGVQSEQLKRFTPAAGLSSFIIDYGYEATRWVKSREAILREVEQRQSQLTAVNGLKQQIERTSARLRACHSQLAAEKRPATASPKPSAASLPKPSKAPVSIDSFDPSKYSDATRQAWLENQENARCSLEFQRPSSPNTTRSSPELASRESFFSRPSTWIATGSFGSTIRIEVLAGGYPPIRATELRSERGDFSAFDNVASAGEISFLLQKSGVSVAAYNAFAADQRSPRETYKTCGAQVLYRRYFTVPPPMSYSVFLKESQTHINFGSTPPLMIITDQFWGPNDYEHGATSVKHRFTLSRVGATR